MNVCSAWFSELIDFALQRSAPTDGAHAHSMQTVERGRNQVEDTAEMFQVLCEMLVLRGRDPARRCPSSSSLRHPAGHGTGEYLGPALQRELFTHIRFWQAPQ